MRPIRGSPSLSCRILCGLGQQCMDTGDERLEFRETEAGTTWPSTGRTRQNPLISGSDTDGHLYFTLAGRLEVGTSWNVTYPERARVPLGRPSVGAPVQGAVRALADSRAGADPVSVEWLADDLVGIHLP